MRIDIYIVSAFFIILHSIAWIEKNIPYNSFMKINIIWVTLTFWLTTKHMSPMQLSRLTRKYYTNLMCNDRPPYGHYLFLVYKGGLPRTHIVVVIECTTSCAMTQSIASLRPPKVSTSSKCPLFSCPHRDSHFKWFYIF